MSLDSITSFKPKEYPFIRIDSLVKHFSVKRGMFFERKYDIVHAVDDVSINIMRGETLGLVGESGCGKSTLGRTLLMLYKPTSGSVIFDNIDLGELDQNELRKMRQRMQMVFQDPYSSLDPRMTIFQIVSEPLRAHGTKSIEDKKRIVIDTLNLVGIGSHVLNYFPHQFSGGQRQRIGLARALTINPEFIVCDEPISSLDVSIQAQVVNLLKSLQRELNLTYLFISHDLSMVRHISDRVAVMYLGKIVEVAQRDSIFKNPLHPYTEALLSSVPVPKPKIEKNRTRIILEGDVPNPINPPNGCRFNTRCRYSDNSKCKLEPPPLREIEKSHFVACHYSENLRLDGLPSKQ